MKENEFSTEEKLAQFLRVIKSTGHILGLYKKKVKKLKKRLHTVLNFNYIMKKSTYLPPQTISLLICIEQKG